MKVKTEQISFTQTHKQKTEAAIYNSEHRGSLGINDERYDFYM